MGTSLRTCATCDPYCGLKLFYLELRPFYVIPAKGGIQFFQAFPVSRLRGGGAMLST